MSRLGAVPIALFLALTCVPAAPAATTAADAALLQQLQTFERSIAADPENLTLAADYRRLVIESAQYDRSIDFFERLAKRKDVGPNERISLAMAYVDKVPPAGDIRRLYLGRDAMNALTKSIAQRPCALAYYFRGRINLYYNRFIFNRTDKGVADLEQALTMTTTDTPPELVAQIYASLGDGYFKLGNLQKARDVWSTGAARFPEHPAIQKRLGQQGLELERTVGQSLAAERRGDTSLAGLLPIP